MKRQLNYFFAFLLLFTMVGLDAQVEFKVTMNEQQEYQLVMRSSQTWDGVQKLTSTGQVTFVVPTGGFELANLQSVTGTWAYNSRATAPTENPNTDYLTVGLVSLGTDAINYQANEEVVLFTFENAGECTGALGLMGKNDPFMYPNTQSINVGNQLTTLGSGNLNAWTGNFGDDVADCSVAQGDVTFVLEQDGDQFNVSLVPSATWMDTKGLTSTGQVTVVVPSNGFEVGDVTNHNGVWINNATFRSPSENPGYDYITFGLSSLGTDEITYEAGQKELLFSFTNNGDCQDEISLIENNDIFVDNSLNVNVGNQITTLGSGNRNAWTKNTPKLDIHCEDCGDQSIATCTGILEPVVICSDICKDDPSYTITNVASELGGNITILNNHCIRYTPLNNTAMDAIDNLIITGCNAQENCQEVVAAVTIGCGGGLYAINDYIEVEGGFQTSINVIANDGSSDDAKMEICMVNETAPANGTIAINEEGEIKYTPNKGFVGQDFFTYTVCNGNGGTASAVVYVSVFPSETMIANINDRNTRSGNVGRLAGNEEVEEAFYKFQVPNVFSPNEDGINDVWTISNIPGLNPDINIFDRVGNMVYQSTEANGVDGWNGQLYNGKKKVDAGTYFYTIKVKVDGETLSKSGFIELRR